MLYQGQGLSRRTAVHRRRREEGRCVNTIWRAEQASGHDHQPNNPASHAAVS